MTLLLRLAVGSGRGSLARLALVTVGTALASALLLVAAGVASVTAADTAVSGSAGTTVTPDGRVEAFSTPAFTGPLTNAYLVEPELRRGVVIGFVLCVVPLLVFVAVASRVAARQREERLAALRLAGATHRQVRGLAALDTAVAAGAGALIGGVAYVVVRAVVLGVASGEVRDIARVAAPAPWVGLLVLLALVLSLSLGSALALRALRITPLGVVRRAPRRRPRPWGLLLLVLALACFSGLLASGVPSTGAGDASLGLCLAGAMVGLVTCGPWLVSLTGRAAARVPGGPAWLLAGRRLEDEPRAQARALSSVTLVVLAATIGLVVLEDFRQVAEGNDPSSDAFARAGFTLAFAGMLLSLVVGAAGLLLTTLEGLLERRRTTSRMLSGGVPAATLRRSTLLQAVLPTVPASVLAVLSGLAATATLAGDDFPGVPPLVLLLPVAAVACCLVAVLPTLPALPRRPVPELLRAE